MNPRDKFLLGIDLGGTKIYAAVTDSSYRVLGRAKCDSDRKFTPEEAAEAMYSAAREAIGNAGLHPEDICGIGAAVPSPVDPETGDCLCAANLNWKNIPLKRFLSEKFGMEVRLENDANLGLLAESRLGAARGFRSVAAYFIGTGLGGGIMLNGKLYKGPAGLAGELGHCTVRAGGRRCGCGHRGCAEAYCSKIAFVKALKKEVFKRGGSTMIPDDKFNEKTKNIKSRYLARAYESGDPSVRKVVDKGLHILGMAAASVCSVISPECIVIGGGFAGAMGKNLLPPFESSFRAHLACADPERIEVRLSELGDDAVAVGAAILAGENP